ncbi:MAG: hypothetical protein ABSD62_12425 [Candidatus Limnocylindrales bacterium]|jgi:hypothetical protein
MNIGVPSGMANPMTAAGDIIVGGATATPAPPIRLPLGAIGDVLTVGAGGLGYALPAPPITWPLTNAGDMGFQPDGVANNALTLKNAANAAHGVVITGTQNSPVVISSDVEMEFEIDGGIYGPQLSLTNKGADAIGGGLSIVSNYTDGTNYGLLLDAQGSPSGLWIGGPQASFVSIGSILSVASLVVTGNENVTGYMIATSGIKSTRITKRVLAVAGPGATPIINTNNYDVVHLTALATPITSMTTNLSGAPVDGDTLRISFTDNGAAQGITWGASFEASTVALPTTTVISTRLDVGFLWNTETSKWRCVAVA